MNKTILAVALTAALCLSGCTTIVAANLSNRAADGCRATKTYELRGGNLWESASSRLDCYAPAVVPAASSAAEITPRPEVAR